jgi:hypothetical protein
MSLQPPVIEIGDAVVIESKVNKVGTNVGFSTATVRTSAGEPVCFGSHVKFLPLGFGASAAASNAAASCRKPGAGQLASYPRSDLLGFFV